MTSARDLILADPAASQALGGLAIGATLGWVLHRTGFCAMGGVSDWRILGDTRRLRAWGLAGAVAILGAAYLESAGIVELERSMYLAPRLNWLGSLLGGVMFGFGMVLAGGCASRNLVRAGSGDLRALLTLLVVALFTAMTIGGVVGPGRDWMETSTAIMLPTGTQRIQEILGLNRSWGAAAAGLLLAAWCFSSRAFRSSRVHMLSGIGVGVAVIAGWALTGLAFDEMSARPLNPASLTFVKPTADTLDWLGRSTALGLPGFGPATVIGTLLGAFSSALAGGTFRLATFHDVSDTLRHLAGGALMGSGGVLALGCTVGQGITGLSTLAAGSVLSLAAIIAGAVLALRALERWM